ncbi:MAG: lipopolysaccharide biosynthesis protein [Acinetobacter sp.]|nr:MAG: lipopolysaccharide biosynthesis protein [Acinetobacter sp.]
MTQPSSRQVTTSMLWSLVRVWGNRLGGLLIFLVLARLLSPSDFGVYAALWAILFFVELFADLGLGDALIQRQEIDQKLINSVFLVNLGLAVSIYGIIWLVAPPLSAWAGSPEIALPLQIAAISIVLNALGYCQLALCRRNFAYRWLAVRSLVATAVSGIFGVALAFAGYGYWALVVQFVVMALINVVVLWLKPVWRPSMDFSLSGVIALLPYSARLTGSRIFEASSTRLFELGIGALLGAAALGVYSIGSRITQIAMQMLSNVVLDVAHATLSRLAKDENRFREAYLQGLSLTAMVAVPAFVIFAALAPDICVVLFGQQWSQSAPVLHALALFGAIQALQYMNGAALNASGHAGKNLIMSIPKLIVSGVMLFCFSNYGITFLAQGFALGCALFLPLSFLLAKKVIDFSWLGMFNRILPLLAASAGAYIVVEGGRYQFISGVVPNIGTLFVLLISGIVAYLLCLFLLAPSRLRETIAFISAARSGS